MPPVTLFSFFSGAGLLDLGFEDEGFSIAFVNEINPIYLRCYRFAREKMRRQVPRYGYCQTSVTDLLADTARQKHLSNLVADARRGGGLVGFIAGPPCPDFSLAGNHRGRDGDKGRLSESYMQLVKALDPDFFLYENVHGLWRAKKHRLFYEHMKELLGNGESTFATTDRLLNALHYGVPQDRNRVILLGFRRGWVKELGIDIDTTTKALPASAVNWLTRTTYTEEQIGDRAWPTTNKFQENSELSPKKYDVILPLTVEHWFRRNHVDDHPNAGHHFRPHALQRFLTIPEGDVSGKSFKRLHRWRYSPTAAYGNNEVHLHPYKSRRISAAEALAVQSVPAEFCLPDDIPLSHMFKMIGNGVPYLMARGVAGTVRDFLASCGVLER